jgi:beta-lactam-binding protein with PASTA domain
MIDDEDPPNWRRGPGWFAVTAISLFVSVLASAGTVVWLHRARPQFLGMQTREESIVTVPSLRHLPLDIAREVASSRGLRLERRGQQADPEIPPDRVAVQSPEPGERVARGKVVQVDLSKGPVPVVPPILGRTLADARSALAAAALPIAGVEETGVIGAGVVTATRPAPGEPVVPGAGITLVVTPAGPAAPATTAPATPTASATPEAPAAEPDAGEVVEVPALRNLQLRRARESLEAAGLRLGQVRTIYDPNARPRVVLRQTPEPATRAPRGTAVDIVVNQGE